MKYVLQIGNMRNKMPLLQQYWLYIGNICSETTILQKYGIYTRNIGNEITKLFLFILQQCWENYKHLDFEAIFCANNFSFIQDKDSILQLLFYTQNIVIIFNDIATNFRNLSSFSLRNVVHKSFFLPEYDLSNFKKKAF